jgi:hypothetical protein
MCLKRGEILEDSTITEASTICCPGETLGLMALKFRQWTFSFPHQSALLFVVFLKAEKDKTKEMVREWLLVLRSTSYRSRALECKGNRSGNEPGEPWREC